MFEKMEGKEEKCVIEIHKELIENTPYTRTSTL